MTSLRQDLYHQVEIKNLARLEEIREIFEEVKLSVDKIIRQKKILNVPREKEESQKEQIEANIKLVDESISQLKPKKV